MAVATRRIDKFLHIAEAGNQSKTCQLPPPEGVACSLSAASFSWAAPLLATSTSKAHGGGASDGDGEKDPMTQPEAEGAPGAAAGDGKPAQDCLCSLDLVFASHKLHGIIGRVGSGKTSLLMSMLGETTKTEGVLQIDGSIPIAYVPQVPWVLNASVRENVVMGAKMDEERYNAVISACALDADIAKMPFADMTELGERGVTVSGGQKLRVALARACYSDATVVLLDDPLSAVDAHVGRHIFSECIQKLLLEQDRRTVTMATHQLHTVHSMDSVCLLEEGRLVMQGTPTDVAATSHPLASEISHQLEDQAEPSPSEDAEGDGSNVLRGGEVMLVPAADAEPEQKGGPAAAENTVMVKESKQVGEVTWATFGHYVRSSRGGAGRWALTLSLFLLTQATKILCDVWVAFWAESSDPLSRAEGTTGALDMPFIDDPRAISGGEYVQYFACLTAAVFVLAVMRSLAFTSVVLSSANKIHIDMFTAVLDSPTVFFESNPLGRILNRFSNDLDRVDTELPKQGMDAMSED
eukprot:SAG22_NODE_669_length_7994_cov_2.526536_5_plen_524_part_00